ncbi:MAG: hypothetical protein E7813_20910 [Bradyrhizobium sp.]|uniref:hypothetical protein n=1 Tax=Bradyrhizobium sp. TaxID=376 RepID=UPI0011FB258E|nr:hypothetical protein [Bradyrhizobium sp.]THD62071.1 MAG: hypothetical protein E7813_20910 [Bradyrhizobium sp.]
MRLLTRDDVIKAVAGGDDVTIAQIIGTGATIDELAEAQAWLANDEPLMNAGKPLATGRVRELVDILSELEADEVEEKETGPVASQE